MKKTITCKAISCEDFHDGRKRLILRGTIENKKWTVYVEKLPLVCNFHKEMPLDLHIEFLGFSSKGDRNVGVANLLTNLA